MSRTSEVIDGRFNCRIKKKENKKEEIESLTQKTS